MVLKERERINYGLTYVARLPMILTPAIAYNDAKRPVKCERLYRHSKYTPSHTLDDFARVYVPVEPIRTGRVDLTAEMVLLRTWSAKSNGETSITAQLRPQAMCLV